MKEKILKYISNGKKQGYKNGIPDEVPEALMRLNLAPSYKAIAIAIMKNDYSLKSLGFTPKKSQFYDVLKKIELSNNGKIKINEIQMELF